MNRQEMEQFITAVFNYYNGIINICVPAELRIEWVRLPIYNNAAITKLPNIITVHPNSIFNFFGYDIEKTKIYIIESIIHELYHIDQIIDFTYILEGNKEYINMIEAAVEAMTRTYILNNHINIRNVFGIDMLKTKTEIEYYNDYIGYFNYPLYERKSYLDHVLLTLKEMLRISSSNAIIAYGINIVDDDSTIIFVINNNELVIKRKNDYYVDINEFNRFISNNFYIDDLLNSKLSDDYDKETNTLTLYFDVNGKHIMCR